MNFEPGFFDIGSSNGSPLENFMDPDFAELNPFVPQ